MGYKIQWTNNDVILSFFDELSFEDLFEVNTRIYSDKRFEKMNFQIVDFRNISSSRLSNEEKISLGNQEVAASFINNKIKIAIIIGNPELIMVNSQAYIDALADTNWQLQGFDDINKALEWCRNDQ